MFCNKKQILLVFIVLNILLVSPWISFSQVNRQSLDSLLPDIKNDTVVPYLVSKIKAYTLTIDRNTSFIKRKIKLAEVWDTLPGIERQLKRFKERLDSATTTWNLRGLNSTSLLLKGVAQDLSEYQSTLNGYSSQLTKNNNDLKVILTDTLLSTPMPSAILAMQMEDINEEAYTLDTIQKNTLAKVNFLRNGVSVALLQASDIVYDLNYMSISQTRTMWGQEELPLLSINPVQYKKPLATVIVEGMQRMSKNINRYLQSNLDTAAWVFLLFIFITVWSITNMRKIKKLANAATVLQDLHFNRRSVLVVGVMGLFTYAPFFFSDPTMPFLHACELVRLLALSFLLWPYFTKPSKMAWLVICILWFIYAVDDLLLESAYGERWWLLIAGLVLAATCIKLIAYKKSYFKGLQDSAASKALLIFCLCMTLLSIIFNLTGRVTLAKIFGVTAIQSLVLGMVLKVFSTLVLEAIFMQSEAYQKSRISAFINFQELQYRFKKVLWVIAIVVWLVALVRDLFLHDYFKLLLIQFFSKQRAIGSITFTFQSVAIFFIIIWLSTVISKFINFFFGQQVEATSGKRSSLGSMLLLIRLSIWAIGFFIAMAASGIPFDRLSLIIGALSVGIGFGLQSIVNNLVSGIIIAFEQPIQVGDQIEVGNKNGVVKEIGVRSSKIRSGDGADIIIPNGDLLSQHLINWTLQNRNRRVEFVIGLPYSSDIPLAKFVIEKTLSKNEKILQEPVPLIILKEFAEKSIDMRVMFWVPDLSTAGSLRSIAMVEIYEALKNAGVEPSV